MNWRRGLLRLWVVSSALWITFVVGLTIAMNRDLGATMSGNIEVSGPDGSSFSFPEGTSFDTIKSALSKHYGVPSAPADDWGNEPIQYDTPPAPAAAAPAPTAKPGDLRQPGAVAKYADRIVGDYRPRSILALLWRTGLISFLPPSVVMLLGLSVIWIARGFAPLVKAISTKEHP